ncbi:MAG TPA: ABC transporter permease, partial [Gemmatimonadales bacterium]|nr:ABC transporter permease [Gemmatimonadales bacterium]
MLRYVARRIGQGVVTIFLVVTLTFVLIHVAPGDPLGARRLSHAVSPAEVAQMRRNLGLDKPIAVQYVRYLAHLASGDLGISIARDRPVARALADAIPNTVVLALAGLLVEFLIGVGVGIVQALKPGSALDRVLAWITLTLFSTPVFWLGLMLMFLFGQYFPWLPIGGVTDPVFYPFLSPLGQLGDRLVHLILPAVTLGLVGAGYVAQHQRAAMLEALRQDFVRTARAKGLPQGRVVRHALRNALLPTIAILGLALPVVLSGAVLVETIFAWPGMGKLAYDAILQRDYPVVTAT